MNLMKSFTIIAESQIGELLSTDELYLSMWIIFFLIIGLTILMLAVQKSFIKKNEMFALKQSSSQKTGAQVSQMILNKNGITNINVVRGQEGKDHFDPKKNIISLSPSVYDSSSVSAMAIAAHECGHAIQWKKKTLLIRFRNIITTPVTIATQIGQAMFSMGLIILLFSVGNGFQNWLIWITIAGLILYASMGLFQLVTLPIEFDASKKAKKQLEELKLMVTENDIKGTKSVLNSAAMTYVVAFLSTATILAMFIVRIILMMRNK